jgi:hypothetical protein
VRAQSVFFIWQGRRPAIRQASSDRGIRTIFSKTKRKNELGSSSLIFTASSQALLGPMQSFPLFSRALSALAWCAFVSRDLGAGHRALFFILCHQSPVDPNQSFYQHLTPIHRS